MKECLKLLIKLHNAGLAHLDISPENILISNNSEFRLCDLAKSAPMYTYNLRHIKGDEKKSFLFQSYQPCIGKLTCMPKECWDIVKEYMRLKIKNPLEYLKSIKNQEERKKFYFDVLSADKYMLGILYIWIWNNNYIWKRADPSKDKIFSHLLNYNMDINSIKLAEDWPKGLKNIINKLLDLESRMKINLDDLWHLQWNCYTLNHIIRIEKIITSIGLSEINLYEPNYDNDPEMKKNVTDPSHLRKGKSENR
ncbi:trophozoite antigen [Plasmodium falciparum RAJ116]|uniref:non-specific serine/threonine protein kinase n=1 Tax=Plasmodium falciparum RAJ116 TaxID=580058 RepID=A0A0L0D0Q5_PLAFA|nr:trophozoite antigen [Plasmodium falciparum RAJ116]